MKTQARRFLDSRSFLVLTGLLYLALAGLLLYILGARTKPEIEVMLTKLIPKVLWANFLLIAAGVVLCWQDIAGAFRGLFAVEIRRSGQGGEEGSATGGNPGEGETGTQPGASLRRGADRGFDGFGRFVSRLGLNNRPGLWLLLVFIVGLVLASQVAPQIHRIYYDEDIYANMAQNIAFTGQSGMANYGSFEYGEYFVNWLGYNKDPSGWPFLISLAFQLFGTDETLAFYLNNLLFAGGILIVFFIVRLLAGGMFAGLIAALVFAIIPHNLVWSNTAAAETSAAFFAGFAVLCTLVYLRTRASRHLFLLAVVLPFACYMRAESLLITLWAFTAVSFNLFHNVSQPQPPFR
ncbi:MAG: glycosyltransferase family 39 protein, partial [Syntrophales bacterium]|nr:glycosyltransferase family 39 protein [Syntrophales bacterium]